MDTLAWTRCFDALQREFASFFGAAAFAGVLRRAGRLAARNEADREELVAGLPLEADGEAFLLGAGAHPAAAPWLAGVLEGADPASRAVCIETLAGDGLRFVFAPRAGAEVEDPDFVLPDHGPLTPHQLAQVADLSDDAILFVDRERRIRAWNRGATAMFGFSAEEAVGSYFDLLVPDDLRLEGELDRLARRTEDAGTIRDHVTRRRTKNGQELTVSLTRTKVVNRDGGIVGYGVILRDISASERMKKELHTARQLAQIGELASQVAHEVRNPLAGVHGALQVLRRRMQPTPDEAAVFEDIAREITRLDRLVTDLLRFGRPVPPRLVDLEFSPWLEDWRTRMNREASRRGAHVELRIAARPRVSLDPVLFEAVLRNLFENAIEAAAPPRSVRLDLGTRAGRARLVFTDDGPGFAPDLRIQALQPFFTTKTSGSGLGLPICARHMQALGGTLEILPDPGGARIELTLPLATPPAGDTG